MMKLTREDGQPVYLRPEAILGVTVEARDQGVHSRTILFTGWGQEHVQELVGEVLALLAAAPPAESEDRSNANGMFEPDLPDEPTVPLAKPGADTVGSP